MSAMLPTLELTASLKALFAACETYCVAGCCGIDAFDFSPLRIAAYLTLHTGSIVEDDLQKIDKGLNLLLSQAEPLEPDAEGFLCELEGTNQYFTRKTLEELILTIQRNSRLAEKVVAYSNEISQNEP